MASPRFDKETQPDGYKLMLWTESFLKSHWDCGGDMPLDEWSRKLIDDSEKYAQQFQKDTWIQPLAHDMILDIISYLIRKRNWLDQIKREKNE